MRTQARLARTVAYSGVAIAILAGVLAGCSSSSGGSSPASSAGSASSLTIDVGSYITTLDPASACHQIDTGITNTLYAQLTQYATKPGPDGLLEQDTAKVVPYLAKSWTVSPDGKTYTFHLRPGMKFPSGDPVDSAAVKFSINRTVTINGCGAYGITDGLTNPPQFEAIDTPNPTTVVFHLGQANSDFLQNLAQWSAAIYDPKVVDAHGGVVKNQPNAWMASHDVGYGPYLIQSYQPNKQLVLTANPNFITQPVSKKLVINFFNSDAPMELLATSGKADITVGMSDQAAHSLASNACCRVAAFPYPDWDKIVLPNTAYPFTNADFRAALSYAVPYQEILQKVYYGYGQPFYGIWSPAEPWFNPTTGAPRPFDLTKAKALLKASGLKTPISFPLLVVEGNSIESSIASIVQSTWAELGVKAQIQTVTPAVQQQDAYATYKYAVLWNDGPGVVSPSYQWDYDGACGSAFNSDRFCDKTADQLMARLRKTTSTAEEDQVTNQVDKMWIAQSPRIPVMQQDFVVVLNKSVKKFAFYTSARYDLAGF
jgi:peptide/nickel transport system substrate-binding protein